MKKLLLPALCWAVLLGGTTACNDNKSSADTATDTATTGTASNDAGAMPADSGSGDMAAAMPADTATAPHKDDPTFMMSAAHSDQNEIQLSQLVLDKGATGMVKDHANMMIKDHTKSTADLKPIAQKKGVKLPTDMDAEHKAIAEQMKSLSGKELEQKYLQQMQMDHQKTLNTLKAHSTMTQDADLQGFIGKVTPVVQAHLDMFQKHASM